MSAAFFPGRYFMYGYGYGYGIDWTYIILVLPAVIFSL